jgi:hypothetical protein
MNPYSTPGSTGTEAVWSHHSHSQVFYGGTTAFNNVSGNPQPLASNSISHVSVAGRSTNQIYTTSNLRSRELDGLNGWTGDETFDNEGYPYDEEPNDEDDRSNYPSRTNENGYSVGYAYQQSYSSQQHYSNAGNSSSWL